MEMTEFQLRLYAYMAKHGFSMHPDARAEKMAEEHREFQEAHACSTKEHADDEALDMVIVAIANAMGRGIPNILDACCDKLDRSTRKYLLQSATASGRIKPLAELHTNC